MLADAHTAAQLPVPCHLLLEQLLLDLVAAAWPVSRTAVLPAAAAELAAVAQLLLVPCVSAAELTIL